MQEEVRRVLLAEDFDGGLDALAEIPRRRLLRMLMAGLYEGGLLRWRAVTAAGAAAAAMAARDMDSARDFMRRQMWNLNDESGGYAEGAPEVMAEAMAGHPGLAAEFSHLLVSFITPEGLWLDNPELLKGAVWGIGRLGWINPGLLQPARPRLMAFLESDDAALAGLSCWALAAVGAGEARPLLEALRTDERMIELYDNHRLTTRRVGDLAGEAAEGPAPASL